MATLTVSDNGRGLAPAAGEEGSGHRLIRALADQIRGDLSQTSTAAGTTVSLRFAPRSR
jgi:two-component sensor histidine kinase